MYAASASVLVHCTNMGCADTMWTRAAQHILILDTPYAAGEPVQARDCKDISLAYLYATTPHMFSAESHTEQAFSNVRDAVHTPLYGCDCYAYGLLATGCVDLVVEADLKPYDYMALVPVVQEAGGTMTDWLVSFCQLVRQLLCTHNIKKAVCLGMHLSWLV